MSNYVNRQIAFQPIGSQKGEINLEKTVNNCIDLDGIKELLCDNHYKNLLEIYPNKKIRIWGVQAVANKSEDKKRNSPNIAKWDKLQNGTKILFYWDKKFIKSATVTYVLWNKKIAEHLWDLSDTNEAWECLYCINDVRDIDINAQEVFDLIESKESHVQGFRVLEESKAKILFDKYKESII